MTCPPAPPGQPGGPAWDLPYRELFEVHPHPMWLFDRDTLRFLMVNEAAVRRYGYTRAEFLEMSLDELWPQDDVPALKKRLEDIPRGVDDSDIWRHVTRGGREFPARVTGHDVRVGDRWARLVQAQDVSEEMERRRDDAERLAREREAREQAEAAEERYRLAFEGAAIGIAMATPEGRIEYANAALCETLGYTSDELIGMTIADVTHPEDRDGSAAIVRSLVSGERQTTVTEKRNLRKDGSPVWARTSVSALRGPDGTVNRLIAVIEDLTERRAAQERLSESRRLLQIAGSIARVGGWYVDLAEGVARWSDEVCAIHEVPPGTRPTIEEGIEHYAPEWRPLVRERFEACAEHGEPYDLEVELVTATGRRIWVRTVGVPVRNEEGAVVAVQGAFQDIHSVKQQTARINRLARRLTRILESITDAFLALDRDWRVTYVNAEAERLLQRSRDELLGQVVWEEFPEAVGTAFQTQYERAVRERETVQFEAYYAPLATWFEVNAYPSEEGLSVLFQDVTEQRAALAALRESEERFRTVARATTDAVWDWDPRTDELWWSGGMQTLFGFTREEMGSDSATWTRRIHPDDRADVLKNIRGVIDGDGELYEAEYRFQRADGSYARVRDRGYVIRDDEGHPVRMIGGMADVTAERRLETQLLRVQRMESIGNLAGGIAHDLNNVLTPILLSVGLLESHVDDEEGLELLASVEASANRAVGLVRQVLAFARGVEGTRGPVDLEKVVEEVAGVVRETFPRGIDFVVEVPDALPEVMGDATQIHQVLLNLCVNARDAMPTGGRLRIGLEAVRIDPRRAEAAGFESGGRYVRVEVEDSGTGMPPGVIDQIFDPFYTTKEAGGGTGLGLSVVASIMRAHGGSISVESEAGRGTRFDLYFPAVAEKEADDDAADAAVGSDPGDPDEERPRSGNGEWILVVDDEAAVRSTTSRTLKAFGYQVRTASEGEAALAALEEMEGGVAAVVTDLMMPGMDGSELIAELHERYPDVPVLAASGLEPDHRTAEAIEDGRVRFLAKPYTAHELVAEVRAAIGEKR